MSFDPFAKLLNENKTKTILIKLKEGKTISGNLQSFDQNMTLTLENTKDITSDEKSLGNVLLRGSNIIVISLPEDSKNWIILTKLKKHHW